MLKLMHEELDDSKDDNGEPVVRCKWTRFEYVHVKTGKKKKLKLVTKVTTPKEMFTSLKTKLSSFPSHQFRVHGRGNDMTTYARVCRIITF